MILLLTLSFALSAQAINFGIGGEVGTLGYGGTATLQLNDNFQTRAKITTTSISFSETIEAFDVKYNIDGWSFSGFFDWFPTGESFRLSLGLVQMSDVDVEATPRNPQSFLNRSWASKAEFDLAPYVGIGFGSTPKRRLSAQLDIGVIIQSYTLDFNDNSYFIPAPPDSVKAEITDRLDLLKIYPVISLSVIYGF